MAAVGDIRYTVRAALITELRNHPNLTGVQIEHGYPGDELDRESIWLADSDGDLEIPNFHGKPTTTNPITVDDIFTVPIEIQAAPPGKTMAQCEARLQVMTQAVEAVLRILPTLRDLDGLMWTRLVHMRGPLSVLTKEGAVCFARIEAEARARTTIVP